MGISINIATQLARIGPHLRDCRRGVMLGRQQMNLNRAGWKSELVRRLNAMGISCGIDDLLQDDGFCEKFLSTVGFPPMESADFTHLEGAEHVFDLGADLPSELEGQFDLVYDGGTTEHVFDIAQAFRNVDKMLKNGGIFLSNVGADGWYGHGFYQIGPDVPWRFWVASMGYEMIECVTYNRGDKSPPEPVPDPSGVYRGGEKSFSRPQFIFYAVRKLPRSAPPEQVVQSHYIKFAQ